MITASLVLYNSKPSEVQRVLECVEKSSIERVYVIDNSSTDSLRHIIKPDLTKVCYFWGQGNVGFGEGNNIGITEGIKSGAKYHVVLNPDIIFEPRVIEGLFKYMEAHCEIGAIKPALIHADGTFNASALMLPSPLTILGKRLLPKSLVKKINYYHELQDLDLTVIRDVPNFSGSFMFLRVSVLKEIGLFDDRYFMYFEDFDLVRRIHEVSKVVYYPDETIIHAHAAEHRYSRKLFLISLRAAFRYFNKWGWIFDMNRRKWNKDVRKEGSVLPKL